MKVNTIQTLINLTNNFYNTVGSDFSKTRQSPWHGWETILEKIGTELLTKKKLTVLDIGCGNGRFCTFLSKSIDNTFNYTGIDSNEVLLQDAKTALQSNKVSGRLLKIDLIKALVDESFDFQVNTSKYDVVSCFGVLHHVPSTKLRLKLISKLSELVTKGGYLVLSLWQFAELRRYQLKLLAPTKFGIKANDLEASDYLLGWGDRRDVARYCHSFTETEITNIIKNSKLHLVDRFAADGKEGSANAYLVLQKE